MYKHTSRYLFVNIVSAVIAIFTLPIFTKFLSPSDFGILVIFFLFGALISNFLSLGLQMATSRFFFKEKKNSRYFKSLNFTNLLTILFIYLFFSIPIFFYSDQLAFLLFKNEISGILLFYSYLLGCIMRIYYYLNELLIITEKSELYLKINLATVILVPLISIIILYTTTFTYEARVISSMCVFFIFTFIFIFITKNFFFLNFNFNSLKKSLKFSYPQMPNTIVNYVNESTDKIIVNNYFGSSDVGILWLSYRISDISKLFITSFLQSWGPFFYKNLEKKVNTLKIIEKYYEIIGIISFLCLSISVFSQEIVTILTNENFFSASNFIPLICLYIFITHIFSVLTKPQLVYAEKLKLLLLLSFLGVTLNIILSLYLVPLFGILGAILAVLFSGFFSTLIGFYYGQRFCPLPINLKKILNIILIYIFIIYLVYLLNKFNISFIFTFLIKFLLISAFVKLLFVFNFLSYKIFINFYKVYLLKFNIKNINS